jgi:hypothetical protein
MCIICENNGYIPQDTKVLDCSGCTALTHFPDHLPDGLEGLWDYDFTALTHYTGHIHEGLETLWCRCCTSLIFGPSSVIEQVGKEIVESNYRKWFQKQNSKYFSIRNDSLIAEELVKKACHPNRIAWYTEWDEWKELESMGMV